MTIRFASTLYGRCSDEYYAVARAWEKVCVFNDIFPQGRDISDCDYSLDAPYQVCLEDNGFDMCLQGAGTTDNITWTIIGSNSTNFNMSGTQIGNSTQSNNCVQITSMPIYPYYPRTITVDGYWTSTGFRFQRRLKIIDCGEKDFPTCEEYYGLKPSTSSLDNVQNNNFKLPQKVIVYDLLGKIIFNGNYHDYQPSSINYNGILIVVLTDKSGEVIDVKKSLFIN